ncbi:MAG TPA: hypothetical protein VFQ27_02185 [Xanthobacteraceae bacterium]|nr:hypothetical protein [Xanthobacteraceae bacterium]
MASYEINVIRYGKSGWLIFNSGDVSVFTTCWWDPNVVIDENSDGYVAYATHMANKNDSVTHEKRPAIWLGKGVKYANGSRRSNGIFIHEGKNSGWSDGCIVAERAEVLKIWNAIVPKETDNVLVKVVDGLVGDFNRPAQWYV